jgi:adenine C2-methylase RlmN of 23S rRNA A2503 and tRNA A37
MFTTVGIKPDFIDKVDETDLDVSVLQITMVHHDSAAVFSRFGASFKSYDFDEICRQIAGTRRIRVRMNYVVIRDFNDAPAVYKELVRCLSPLKNKLQVRVSALNETMFGIANGCKPASEKALDEICSAFSQAGIGAYVLRLREMIA